MTPRKAARPARAKRTAALVRKLTAARLAAGLTQEELAGRLGVCRASLANWESGRTAPDGLYLDMVATFIASTRPSK